MLDKESLSKLLVAYTPLKVFEISDIKIRDTYSFVSVVKGNESKIFKLKGIVLGKREVNVQQAVDGDKPVGKTDGEKFKSKEKTGSKTKPDSRSKGNKKDGGFKDGKSKRGNYSAKSSKPTGKSSKDKNNKPVSRKSKFYSNDEL